MSNSKIVQNNINKPLLFPCVQSILELEFSAHKYNGKLKKNKNSKRQIS